MVRLTHTFVLSSRRSHFHVVDASGKSVVLEWSRSGQLVAHDNPLGVLANNPRYKEQVQVGSWAAGTRTGATQVRRSRFRRCKREDRAGAGGRYRSVGEGAYIARLRATLILAQMRSCLPCVCSPTPQHYDWCVSKVSQAPLSQVKTIDGTRFYPPPGSYNQVPVHMFARHTHGLGHACCDRMPQFLAQSSPGPCCGDSPAPVQLPCKQQH